MRYMITLIAVTVKYNSKHDYNLWHVVFLKDKVHISAARNVRVKRYCNHKPGITQ